MKKTESVSEKPAVKLEVSDNDASIRMSAESNEVNKSTDDECLSSESASSENIPSAEIIKEKYPAENLMKSRTRPRWLIKLT